MMKIEGSGSISQRHGSADPAPDPHQKSWIRNTGCYLPGPPGVRHGRQVGCIAVRPGLLVVSAAATAFQAFQPLLSDHSPSQPETKITKNKILWLDYRFSIDF